MKKNKNELIDSYQNVNFNNIVKIPYLDKNK